MPDPRDMEELRRQLQHVSGDDPKAGEVLREVESYLAEDEPPTERRAGLLQTLSDAIYQFEAEHPRLTAAIQKVVDSLTAAGI